MKIEVRVKAGSKQSAVEKQADGTFLVKVKERALEGQANGAVIEAIAEYFNVPKSAVAIIRGHKSRNKIIEL
jgi:uncharacterized protein